MSAGVRKGAREVLGVTKKGKCKNRKEAWWWGPEVQEVVRNKKVLFKEWRKSKTSEMWSKYKEACKVAKKSSGGGEELE